MRDVKTSLLLRSRFVHNFISNSSKYFEHKNDVETSFRPFGGSLNKTAGSFLEFSIETSKLGTETKKIETQGVALKCDDKVAVTFFHK